MEVVLFLLLIILIIFLFLCFKIRQKIREFSLTAFGTSDIIEGFKNQKIKLETEPKSVAGMECLLLPQLTKDFPNLNINEMKKIAENKILLSLESIEDKEMKKIDFVSEKVKNWIKSKISDLKENETVNYDSINFHRTVLNKYEKNNGICTIVFQTSLEYLYRKNTDEYRKIQDRINTQFIYIFDDSKVTINQSGIALNCPNCGAPIKNLGEKFCDYCGTGVIDIVKKTWILNDISQN